MVRHFLIGVVVTLAVWRAIAALRGYDMNVTTTKPAPDRERSSLPLLRATKNPYTKFTKTEESRQFEEQNKDRFNETFDESILSDKETIASKTELSSSDTEMIASKTELSSSETETISLKTKSISSPVESEVNDVRVSNKNLFTTIPGNPSWEISTYPLHNDNDSQTSDNDTAGVESFNLSSTLNVADSEYPNTLKDIVTTMTTDSHLALTEDNSKIMRTIEMELNDTLQVNTIKNDPSTLTPVNLNKSYSDSAPISVINDAREIFNCSTLKLRNNSKILSWNLTCETNGTYENIDKGNISCNAVGSDRNSSNPTVLNTEFWEEVINASIPKIPGEKEDKIYDSWDHGILSSATLNKTMTYLRIVTIIPVAISMFTVVLSVKVFRDKIFVYPGKPLIISFNIFEGLKCVAYILFRVFTLYSSRSYLTWNSAYSKFFIYYVIWVPGGLGKIGILHNGLIVLDRFFTIVFPIKSLNKRLVSRPKLCIAVVVVGVLLYQLVPLIMFLRFIRPHLDYEMKFNQDEIASVIQNINPSEFKNYSLVLVIGHVLFVYIPLVLALILNTAIIISLCRHEKTRRNLTGENVGARQPNGVSRGPLMKRQTNVVIVGASMAFTVLVLFRRVLPIFSLIYEDFGEGRQEMHIYRLFNEIFHFLDCISPLVNIISYTILSSQFRKRLKEIVIPRRCLIDDANDLYPDNVFHTSSRLSNNS